MTTFTRGVRAFEVKDTPDSASADFSIGTDGATTIANLTATSLTATLLKLPVTAVTAAGSVIGDAAALSPGINVVTGANGTVGVILPVTTGGDIVIIKGVTTGVLKVWPQTGGAVNALSASAAFSTPSSVASFMLYSTSATQWYTLPLLPS